MTEHKFSYDMQITFEKPVTSHQFTLRILPYSNEKQQIDQVNIKLNPYEFCQKEIDGFGNHILFGSIHDEHQIFQIHMDGIVKVYKEQYEVARPTYQLGMYKVPSQYTKMDIEMEKALKAFWKEKLFFNGGKKVLYKNDLMKALELMEFVCRNMEYKQGVTSVTTKAEEAFSIGKGVCQDYAHILLAFCRYEKIIARYVVGILAGEGATHAWVEIYDNGVWIGLDPTNHTMVDDNYMKISSGRDYKDCMVNRGVLYGGGEQYQNIMASLTPIRKE